MVEKNQKIVDALNLLAPKNIMRKSWKTIGRKNLLF